MNKSLILASAIFVLGSIVALVARFTGYPSFNLLNFSAAAGSVFVCSLVLIACHDYAHKPRFRVRGGRNATSPLPPSVTSSNLGSACDWTYTTRSA